uniref:Uncharacterized protein n=1 Tax=Panagrolaimus sp. ES5 TaxID=591445 RepID=A0AC34FPV5_9BILA
MEKIKKISQAKVVAEEVKTEDSNVELNAQNNLLLEGQRASDEFNPETIVFQDDESEEYHCSNFPNQTLIRPHFFSCNSPVRPPILVVHDSAVSNKTGDYQFPLDFSQTVRFFFDVTSFATRRYDNLRAEVYLYRRKTGWLGCGWINN